MQELLTVFIERQREAARDGRHIEARTWGEAAAIVQQQTDGGNDVRGREN